MALRIFGAVVAVLLASFVLLRYRKGQLRRGELFAALIIVAGLLVAALTPDVYDVILSPLGFDAGGERRIVGLLVLSNLLTLISPGLHRSLFRSLAIPDSPMSDQF